MSDPAAKPKTYRDHVADLKRTGLSAAAIATIITGYEHLGIDLDSPHNQPDETVLIEAEAILKKLILRVKAN